MRPDLRCAAGLGALVTEGTMIETELWTPDPDQPGYLRRSRARSLREVQHA